jgi:hypothetical protein
MDQVSVLCFCTILYTVLHTAQHTNLPMCRYKESYISSRPSGTKKGIQRPSKGIRDAYEESGPIKGKRSAQHWAPWIFHLKYSGCWPLHRLSFLLSFPCLTFSYTFCPSSHQPGCPPYFLTPISSSLPLLLPFYISTFSSFQPRSRREFAISLWPL